MAVEFTQINENGNKVQVFVNLDPEAEGKAYELKQAGYELRFEEDEHGVVESSIHANTGDIVAQATTADGTSVHDALAKLVMDFNPPRVDVAEDPDLEVAEPTQEPVAEAKEPQATTASETAPDTASEQPAAPEAPAEEEQPAA